MVIAPGQKRLFVDRVAAYHHKPAVVVEVETGERYHTERAEWDGKTAFVRDHAGGAKPALWVETNAEVTLLETPSPKQPLSPGIISVSNQPTLERLRSDLNEVATRVAELANQLTAVELERADFQRRLEAVEKRLSGTK
jgi:hypothetical protein